MATRKQPPAKKPVEKPVEKPKTTRSTRVPKKTAKKRVGVAAPAEPAPEGAVAVVPSPKEPGSGAEMVEITWPDEELLPGGVQAEVEVHPGGLVVRFHKVPAALAFQVALYGLLGMHEMRRHFDELTPILPDVTGSGGLEVVDDDWSDSGAAGGRTIGFQLEHRPAKP